MGNSKKFTCNMCEFVDKLDKIVYIRMYVNDNGIEKEHNVYVCTTCYQIIKDLCHIKDE